MPHCCPATLLLIHKCECMLHTLLAAHACTHATYSGRNVEGAVTAARHAVRGTASGPMSLGQALTSPGFPARWQAGCNGERGKLLAPQRPQAAINCTELHVGDACIPAQGGCKVSAGAHTRYRRCAITRGRASPCHSQACSNDAAPCKVEHVIAGGCTLQIAHGRSLCGPNLQAQRCPSSPAAQSSVRLCESWCTWADSLAHCPPLALPCRRARTNDTVWAAWLSRAGRGRWANPGLTSREAAQRHKY